MDNTKDKENEQRDTDEHSQMYSHTYKQTVTRELQRNEYKTTKGSIIQTAGRTDSNTDCELLFCCQVSKLHLQSTPPVVSPGHGNA